MLVQEVPQTKWSSFLDRFSRQHRGWLVNLRAGKTEDDGTGDSLSQPPIIRDAELRDVSWDSDENRIDLVIQPSSDQEKLVRPVGCPSGVFLQKTEDGSHQGLRIDDEEGKTTLVEFRAPVHPAQLDGLAESEFPE